MSIREMFSKRVYNLRLAKGAEYTRQRVANELGISRASLEYYEKGQRMPDIEIAAKIADYYNVSTDYLLGRTQIASPSTDLQAVCEYTGLTEKTITNLYNARNDPKNEKRHVIPLPLSYCKKIIIDNPVSIHFIINELCFTDENGRSEWLDLFKLVFYFGFNAKDNETIMLKTIITDFFNTLYTIHDDAPESIDFSNIIFNYDIDDDNEYPF